MKRVACCVLLSAAGLYAQSIESTMLALKDPLAPRKVLSHQLVDQMMASVKSRQAPLRSSVQRFAEDLTTALLGKDITAIRAAELHKSIAGVLSGKGSTFLPAGKFHEVVVACGLDDRTVQTLTDRLTEIGQQIRGPDDLPLRDIKRP